MINNLLSLVLLGSLFAQINYKPSPLRSYYDMKTPVKHYGEIREKALNDQKKLLKTSPFKQLKWQSLGPSVMGGRVTDIAVPNGEFFTFYVAAASGGVWKTENNGTSWTPIFDNYSSITIGDIAVAPTDKNILWVGTGENNSLRSSYAGTGVYKSIDGGKSFQNMGLTDSHHIGRIIIHPFNPEIVYVAVIGHLYTPNEERGLYKTENGGKTWEKVIDKGAHVGVIDVSFSADNPNILFAATWERSRKAWDFVEAGAGSGLYKSVDAGKTWKKLTDGFPNHEYVGRIGLGTTPANPNVVYAMLDNQKLKRPANTKEKEFSEGTTSNKIDSVITGHEVYRSDDLGETWKLMSENSKPDKLFTGPYGYFFGNLRVDPNNEDILYSLDLYLMKSMDGGRNWKNISKGTTVHADHHALWINPLNSNHIINGNDGGIDISYDGGTHWQSIQNLPIGQFYTISVDNETPYNVYGGLQDNGTWRGSSIPPSKSGDIMGLSDADKWTFLTGGDGFYVQVDPTDKNVYYSEWQWGSLMRTENGKSVFIQPKPTDKNEKYRFNWSSPLVLSSHNRFTLYFGGNKLFKSVNRGDSWKEISGDLTFNDQARKGDVTFGTITSISESPIDPDLLYVGTDDGRVWRTENGGATWVNLDKELPKRWVSRVVASKHNKDHVYLALSGYRQDEKESYLFRSTSKGDSWVSISTNLPSEPVNVIREDVENPSNLYLGTDLGVYMSMDLGTSWISLRNNLPTVPVHDLIQHPREKDLLIATHGRSIYTFKGSVLSNFTDSIRQADVHLFDLEDIEKDYVMTFPIYFHVNDEQDVTIKIMDENKDEVMVVLNSSVEKGCHSVDWNGLKHNSKSSYDTVKKGKYYVSIESDGDDILRAFYVK